MDFSDQFDDTQNDQDSETGSERFQPGTPGFLREQIRKKAKRLGFSDCRFCTAEPPGPEVVAAYEEWLAKGMHGEMAFFVRAKRGRLDLHHRYPWAKSVVVVKYDYANLRPGEEALLSHRVEDHQRQRDAAGAGLLLPRIGRYAAGKDYHDVLKEPLEQLEKHVKKHSPGGNALWYQDTGPILEHVYAERSGIGWTGKHTLTLNRKDGSYFWLAEVVTSLELPPDAPATNHCGTCTACIDACPSGAIVAPYVLDARRCISYVTIEQKAPVASELREKLAGYLFGCDICQEACPYVAKQVARDGHRLLGADWRIEALEGLTLLDVLMLRDPKLEAAVAGSPLFRTGAARLKRNAAFLVGAEKIEGALKGLNNCITHPESVVREACAWALGCFGGTDSMPKARQMLVTHMKRESEDAIREVVIEALARLRAADPAPAEPPKELSQAAVWALEKIAAEGREGELDGNEKPGEE